MNKVLTALLTLAALGAASASAAGCAPTTSHPELENDGMYVDNDACTLDCILSIWVYEESNGMPGLQRDDSGRDDTCGGQIEADTNIL
ncbi:MAG TPA: hypothetical protein VM370_07860 [Candidatus Thermoplasmatota archaeon]|nr:hypothetical protein [Candidatus Thermoplasmatota archaeon]